MASFAQPCFSRMQLGRAHYSCCPKTLKLNHGQARCHTFPPPDNGNSTSMVDASMGILKERIEQVKVKERVTNSACFELQKRGWSYRSSRYLHRLRLGPREYIHALLLESIELAGLAAGAVGLVFLTGSLCICFVSLMSEYFIHPPVL